MQRLLQGAVMPLRPLHGRPICAKAFKTSKLSVQSHSCDNWLTCLVLDVDELENVMLLEVSPRKVQVFQQALDVANTDWIARSCLKHTRDALKAAPKTSSLFDSGRGNLVTRAVHPKLIITHDMVDASFVEFGAVASFRVSKQWLVVCREALAIAAVSGFYFQSFLSDFKLLQELLGLLSLPGSCQAIQWC